MQFRKFFLEYKYCVQRRSAAWNSKDKPTYEKVFLVILFLWAIVFFTRVFAEKIKSIVCPSQEYLLSFIEMFDISIEYQLLFFWGLVLVWWWWSNKKENIKHSLCKLEPAYDEYMQTFPLLLKKYNIDTEKKIDLLIDEVERSKHDNNYLACSSKGYVAICAVLGFGANFILQKQEVVSVHVVMLFISTVFIIVCVLAYTIPSLLYILYPDYVFYQKLLSDLRQAKIFLNSIEKNIPKNDVV